MGFLFANKQRDELLLQTQASLDVAQENNLRLAGMLDEAQKSNQMLAASLSEIVTPKPVQEDKDEVSPELVAYALNLCMVSVSQIIEYRDLRIMEQEYDAILNNLNLQRFPKDETLLTAIKQILDSITFFKVQDGERKLLEEEYQHKVKNAIWKAIPGIGIVPGGSLVTTLVSVVAQVGIGYMNYRNAKEEANLEQKRKLWELERAAIEQFNGLRRELFETAWRLSQKYKFDDKCRLTERTISQYNEILQDPDPLRRYERLQYLNEQGKFAAYPPAQYYLGHAANEVFITRPQELGRYCEIAKQHLLSYIKCFENGNDLLREDLLLAQACLEYYSLLPIEEQKHNTWLILRAQEKSGNALDVQQLCALALFQAEEYGEAAKLLTMLTNEQYNSEINAQLLSLVYAVQKERLGIETQHQMEMLRDRNQGVTLMRLPGAFWPLQKCFDEFVQGKRFRIKMEYCSSLTRFAQEYQVSFSSLWIQRHTEVNAYVEFFHNMASDIQQLCQYPAELFIGKVETKIPTIKEHMDKATEFTVDKAILNYSKVVLDGITSAAKVVKDRIESAAIDELIQIESELWEYRRGKGYVSSHQETQQNLIQDRLESAFLGKDYKRLIQQRQDIEACMTVLREAAFAGNNIYSPGGERHLRFALRDDGEYSRYTIKHAETLSELGLGNDAYSVASIVAILNSRRASDLDMVLTTAGIYYMKAHKLIGVVKYSEVRLGEDPDKKVIMIGDNIAHDAKDLNAEVFVKLCSRLHEAVSKCDENQLSREIETIFFSTPIVKQKPDVIYL